MGKFFCFYIGMSFGATMRTHLNFEAHPSLVLLHLITWIFDGLLLADLATISWKEAIADKTTTPT